MKNYYLTVITFLLTMLICNSCEMEKCWHGPGKNTWHSFETDYFGEVNVHGIFEIILVQDSAWYIELEGGEKMLRYTDVKIADSVVNLENLNECYFLGDYEKIKCYLHFGGNLTLTLYEACKVTSQTPVTSDLLLVVPGEMAEINVQFNNSHFHFYNHKNTGGYYTFSGYSDWSVISGFYSAKFELSGLQSREMHINNSTIGDVHVNASELLKVQIHNKGNIYYSGTPEIIIDSISGSGKLLPEN